MRLDLGDSVSGAHSATISLTPLARGVLISLLLVLCGWLGSFMEVTALVTALGLFNVAVVVFLLLKRDLTWGFLFYLTAVIFFQTGFWFRLPGFPDLYPSRIAAIILYLVFLMQCLLSMRQVPGFTRIEKAMTVFLVVLFISVVTLGQQPFWLLLLRGYVFPFLFYYFARTVVSRERQVNLVMGYLVLLGLYLGVMGIFEKLQWYEFVYPKFIVDPTLADHGLTRLGFRVRGIFIQPAVLGAVMTMGFFPAWLYLDRRGGVTSRVLQVALLLVTPTTIFFTQTRSVYLGFLVALIIAIVASRRFRPLCTAIVLAGALAIFLNWENVATEDRDVGGLATMETIHYRVEVAYEAAEIFINSPFVGCGFMNFQEEALKYRKPRDVPLIGHIDMGVGGHAVLHNMLITVFVELGILGLVPYLLVYWFIFLTSLRAYKELPDRRIVSPDFVVCVWCAMAAYFVNAMFLELRYFEYVNVLYFFLMGSMVGMYERHVQQRRAVGAADARVPAARWRPPLLRPGGAV
ncbi:MAG: O-antigen ligase family protein [Candidatus Eiseniibacteriota bacterium]